MATLDESTANEAIKDALKALHRARDLSKRAGYRSLVVGPLVDARRNMLSTRPWAGTKEIGASPVLARSQMNERKK